MSVYKQMVIAERIKDRRLALNLSQHELADAVGVDQSRIWRYEAGKAIPYGDVVARLALVFNTSTDWILGLTDDMIRPPAGELEQDEIELLEIYRSKDPDKQSQLIEIAKVV